MKDPEAPKTAARVRSGRKKTGARAHIRRLPHQTRAQATVRAIVEAAAKLLVERGYGAASTNAIAERAGVSVGSVYQYFSGKTDVFRRLLTNHRAEVHAVVASTFEKLETARAKPVPVLSLFVRQLLELHRRDPALMQAIDTQLGELIREGIEDDEMDALAGATRILQRSGYRDPRDALAGAWLLVVVVSTVSRRLAHARPAGVEPDVVIRLCERMLGGLFAARGRPVSALPTRRLLREGPRASKDPFPSSPRPRKQANCPSRRRA